MTCPGVSSVSIWCSNAPGFLRPVYRGAAPATGGEQGTVLPARRGRRRRHRGLRRQPARPLRAGHSIASTASCTTNAIVPVIQALHETVGIESGTITTIHSAMNDQPVLDAYHHTDLRKTRAHRSRSSRWIPALPAARADTAGDGGPFHRPGAAGTHAECVGAGPHRVTSTTPMWGN